MARRRLLVNEVLVVGCGGLIYHALPRLANIVRVNKRTRLTLVDNDVVEERNGARQWGTDGQSKVGAAQMGLVQLGVEPDDTTTHVLRVDERFRLGQVWLPQGAGLRVVVSLPDNHLARIHVHEAVAQWGGSVWEIMAGNSVEGGMVSTSEWTGRAWAWDWLDLHPDIATGAAAEREAERRTRRNSCSRARGRRAQQTARGNALTATLWLDSLEAVLGGEERPNERTWSRGETDVGLGGVEAVLGVMYFTRERE